jgi:hypothetical protein
MKNAHTGSWAFWYYSKLSQSISLSYTLCSSLICKTTSKIDDALSFLLLY